MFAKFRGVPLFALFALCFALALGGCGAMSVGLPVPTLPDQAGTLTLAELKSIQQNTTLTTDEKAQQIRDATGAPNTPEGDQLVNFLLNFTQP